jgi:putative two-component system response regulator
MKPAELGSKNLLKVIPSAWASEPEVQIIAVRDALRQQTATPTTDTPMFVAAAYESLKALPADANFPALCETLIDVAIFHYVDGHPEASLHPIADAAYFATAGAHKALAARALMLSGSFQGETHNFTAGVSELTRALEIAKETADAAREARVWNNLGVAHLNAGHHSDALAMFEKALALDSNNPERHLSLQNIALVSLLAKDVAKGIAAAHEALAIGPAPVTALQALTRVQVELTLVRLLLTVHQHDEARKHAKAAKTIAAKSGSAQARTLAEIAEGLADVARGRKDIGLTRLKRMIEHARRGSPAGFRFVLAAGIQGYELAGEPDVALVLLHELLELNKRTRGAGLLRHLQRELRDIDLQLDEAASAALVEQEHALLTGQADPARAKARFRLFERASVGAELHDDETGYHVFRVGTMARDLARAFGMPEDTCQVIDYTARLHDIGKITLPEGLLMKPGKFTPGERSIMETHTTEGARLIREGSRGRGLVPMHIAEEIALSHHEKYDGTGYPNKLKGSLIPISARIVAIADVFDALTHARCYKPAWTIDDSLREIAAQRGRHFDPDLTDLFLKLVPDMMRQRGDLESYLSASGRSNPFIRDRAAINRELRGDGGIFDGRL